MKKRIVITAAMVLAAALAGCGQPGTAGKVMDDISAEDARNAAVSAAQIDQADAVFERTEREERDGIPYYEVEFTAGGIEYHYAVDAQTGSIIESDSEAANVAAAPQPDAANEAAAGAAQPDAGGAVDEARAKQIALEHAGVAERDTSFLWVKADRDDGVSVYDVEFYVAATGSEYDYEIDAATGEIRSMDYDAEQYQAAPEQSAGGTTTKSEEEIRQIALAKVPGATEKDIRLTLDRDDGKLRYEGKIVYEGMEYEFEIDAYSGAIQEWDADSVFD